MERKDETRVKGFDLPPGAGRGTEGGAARAPGAPTHAFQLRVPCRPRPDEIAFGFVIAAGIAPDSSSPRGP